MPENPRPVNRAQSLFTVLVVSVLIGVLTAGFVMPGVGVLTAAVQTAAAGVEDLPADLETPPQAERSTLLMADGTRLATFYDENRVYVPLSEIAPVMQQAQLAIEDHRFYEHGPIDVQGTFRALLRNTAGGSTQGGSSITQQYVKMVQIENAMARGDEEGVKKAQEPTIARKVQEMRYAIALEQKLSKDEILERYLNIAYYGDGAYGVEAAARHYFNTSAKKLNLTQAAMLAGLVQNPDSYNPRLHTDTALQRRDVVLTRMAELDPSLADDVARSKKETFDPDKIVATRNGCASSPYPFVCEYARQALLNNPALGETAEERESMLNRGGLTIKTTVTPSVQKSAEKSVAAVVGDRDPALGAVVLIKPGTGEIQAMAQSRTDMGDGKGQTFYNYAATEAMGGAEGYQAGSTFKIFTMAAALEKGIPISKKYPATSPMQFRGQTFRNCDGKFVFDKNWPVKNSTRSAASMDMQTATNYSVNTYYVQLIRDTGICNAAKMASKVGVEMARGGDLVKLESGNPSFVLGVVEVAPVSMAEAMATFASGGTHCDAVILSSITTRDGKNLATPSANCEQVVDPDVAAAVNKVLSGVSANGTGRPARVSGGYAQAGKTGTTDDNQAVWFVGYTPELAGASMIAIDKTNSYWETHRKTLKGVRLPDSGVYLTGSGSGDAGKIYKAAMQAGLKGKPKTSFAQVKKEFTEGKTVDLPAGIESMSADDARAALEDAGFTVQEQYQYDSQPQGTFLGTSPSKQAPQFSTVYLNFSAGPAPVTQQTQQPNDATTDPNQNNGSGNNNGGNNGNNNGGGNNQPDNNGGN